MVPIALVAIEPPAKFAELDTHRELKSGNGFIIGLLALARAQGERVLVITWDHASWHPSKALRGWVRAHSQRAKAAGEPRLLTHL